MINEELKKRLLSLAWRLGLAIIVTIIAVLTKELPNLGLPAVLTGVLILVLNEVTKWLNDKYQLGKRVLGRK
jgi:predicted PurR-regulated permease PerM